MKNKTYKFKFSSAFPIDSKLYFNSRFQLKEFIPFEIKVHDKKHMVCTFEEGLELIRSYQEEGQLIHFYHFHVTDNNTLIETFHMKDIVKFQISTKVEDMISFFNYIFPLFGVLLYGQLDSKEHFLVRDDVCCKFAHEIYPKHTDLSATWWDEKPYINHFFVFPKKERENRDINHVVAIGGEPLEFGYDDIKNTAANFYLMKYIPRYGEEAYIMPTDDMRKVEEFEKNIVLATLEGIKKEEIESTIYYKAI